MATNSARVTTRAARAVRAANAPVKLTDWLYQVAGPGITHEWDASAYLILGDEPTLIDCGSMLGAASLARNLNSLDVSPADITRVIATHGHWDNLSGLMALREHGDISLHVHPADRRAVENGDADRTAAFLFNSWFPSTTVDGEIVDEDIIELADTTIEVMHTPGHTPGSVSLVIERDGVRVLVVGDTLWGGYHPRTGSDLDAWSASIDRLLRHNYDFMLWGHQTKPELVDDVRRRLTEARMQLGTFLNPWTKPYGEDFRY